MLHPLPQAASDLAEPAGTEHTGIQPPPEPPPGDPADDHLLFEAGPYTCAARAAAFDEVIAAARITPLPRVDAAVLGIFHHHGELAIAVDLQALLSEAAGTPFSPGEAPASAKLLILREGRHVTGVRVSSVSGLLRLEPGRFAEPRAGLPLSLVPAEAVSDGKTILKLAVPGLLAEIERRLGAGS